VVNEIIAGVRKKLLEEFGENCNIFTSAAARKEARLNSKSPLREPNFYVSCKVPKTGKTKDRNFTSTQLLGNRYLRTAGICIECRWFPEWQEVLERLFLCLEYINLDVNTVIRGNSMQGEYSDDNDAVLNFFVSYDVFVYQEEKKEIMNKLIKEETKLWH
jgi:hypothetical protein